MKKFFVLCISLLLVLVMGSCKEHYSDGERVGTVTKFSKAGVIWHSWDGHLNITQTGMNSAGEPFEFSMDNDRDDQQAIIDTLNMAQVKGWKIRVKYHQVWGVKNVFCNRGESNYFVDGVEILDKNFLHPLGELNNKAELRKDTLIVRIVK